MSVSRRHPQHLHLEPRSPSVGLRKKFTFDLTCCPVSPFRPVPYLAMNRGAAPEACCAIGPAQLLGTLRLGEIGGLSEPASGRCDLSHGSKTSLCCREQDQEAGRWPGLRPPPLWPASLP